jgi:hypothetical protein
MFSSNKSVKEKEKLPKPQAVPGPVQKSLVADWKLSADLAALFKAVVRRSAIGGAVVDIRIFDDDETLARKIKVNDYTSLDEHPELTLYEGWFDESSKKVELHEKKKVNWDVPFFTEAEIQQKIEALSEPGSSVFFYQARGPGHGGPLGMGAAVIELNPGFADKKGKKYYVYSTDVIDMQPANRGQKLFDSNKPKDIAKWVKESLHKRIY